jgi:outer membrane lipoprotein-sorting protein
MRKLIFLAAFLFLAGSLSAQTADELIAKYIEARGGLAKIKAVKTERVTGSISFGTDASGAFIVERKRPLMMHMEISFNGQPFIRAYDGKSTGWYYNPFVPNPSVQAMGADELRNIFDEADFDGPFVDYKSKGNKIELIDKEEVLGKTAYKLKLTNKLGDVSFFYFDATTNLILKWEGDRNVAGKNVPWQSFFRDYRELNGLKYPFSIDSDAPGTDQTQKITAEKIEVNIPIEDTHFGKPNPPAPPPALAQPAAPANPPAPAEPPKPN